MTSQQMEERSPQLEAQIANLEEENLKQAAFHQALLDSGLVKQIKYPAYEPITERRLIDVAGKLISETIIEERR